MGVTSDYRRDMERRGLLPRSIYRLIGQVRSFDRAMADRGGILAATEADVQAFLDARRIGPRTRYGWLSALHNFYRWAIREGHTGHDPTDRIDRPKLRQTLPRPITDADLHMALRLADPQMRAWLALAAYAGLRCAEIAGLHTDDVLIDCGRLRVMGKGRKERVVPIHPYVLACLQAHGLPRTGPIFRRPRGGAWPPAALSRAGSVYLHEVGIDATMHQLRHWFGTRTYRECKSIRVVQGLLGHSNPSVTAVYTAFSDEDAEAAVLALEPLTA